MNLPLCKTTIHCGQVTSFIRRIDCEGWESIIMVCSECSERYYRVDLVVKIPTSQAMLGDFEIVEYVLEQIDGFRQYHNPGGMWEAFTPDFDSFKQRLDSLKEDYEYARLNQDCEKYCYVSIETKELLNILLESNLYKQYNKQKMYRTFANMKDGLEQECYISFPWAQEKYQEIKEMIEISGYKKLLIKLRRNEERNRKQEKMIKKLEKENMHQTEEIQSQIREIRSHQIQINLYKIEELRKTARIKSQVDAVKQRDQKIRSLENKTEELVEDETKMKQTILNLDAENQKLSLKNSKSDYQILELGRRIHGTSREERKESLNKQNKEKELLKQVPTTATHSPHFPPLAPPPFTLNPSNPTLQTRLSNYPRINIPSIPEEIQPLKTFLSHHFPNTVKSFYCNYDSGLNNSLGFYMEGLEGIREKVEVLVGVCNFAATQSQTITLLSLFKTKKTLSLAGCRLDLSSPLNFNGALTGSTLERLNLSYCGSSDRGDWKNNPTHFENLVKGLASEEDFRNSLRMIVVDNCGMEKRQIGDVLKEYGLGDVKICM
ncbi:unnamed protein product [Moneuplotes crassus]|uniref:Uncharacterized protein n=1 Tax=Euplotes crassus TaxID=5936 RepID=A0AAD1U8K2_EUPCR|nr:unnamed protein product [Moneuplotes crassus]